MDEVEPKVENGNSSGEIEDGEDTTNEDGIKEGINKLDFDERDVDQLDYDEDVVNEDTKQSAEENKEKTANENNMKSSTSLPAKKDMSDGELSLSDGEVVSEDEGEIKEVADDGELVGEYEEGEMRDFPNEQPPDKPRTCRFFEMGTCTWGERCRFLHPGINDKGNYNMFNDSWKKRADTENFPKMDVPSSWDAPEPDIEPQVVETAWERGLRHAKELKRQSLLRKVQEPDFVQKREVLSLNHALNEDRDMEFVDQRSLGPQRRGYDPFLEDEPEEFAVPAPEELRRNGRFDKLRLQSETTRYGSLSFQPPELSRDKDHRQMHSEFGGRSDRRMEEGRLSSGDRRPDQDRDHRKFDKDRKRMDSDSRKMDRDDRRQENVRNRIMDTDHRIKADSPRERGRSDRHDNQRSDAWQDPWARPKQKPRTKSQESSSSDSSSSSGSSSRSSSHSSRSSRSSSRSSNSSRSSSGSSGSDSSRSPSPAPKPSKSSAKKPDTLKAKVAFKNNTTKRVPENNKIITKTTKTDMVKKTQSPAKPASRGRPTTKTKTKKDRKSVSSSSSEFSHSDSSASPDRKDSDSGSDSESGTSSSSADSSYSSSSDSDSERHKRGKKVAAIKKTSDKKSSKSKVTKPTKVEVPSKPGRRDVKMTIINKPNHSKNTSSKNESKKRAASDMLDGGKGKKGSVNRRDELLQQLKAVEDAIAKKRAKLS